MDGHTGGERHQLIEFLGEVSLYPVRGLGFVDASFGIVRSSEIIQLGDFFDHGAEGDDGDVFGGTWFPRLTTVDEMFLGFPVGVEGLRGFKVGWILLRFILRRVSGKLKVSKMEKE